MESRNTKDPPKAHANKTTYMSDEAFADLEQALKDALACERGEHRGLKVSRIQGSCPSEASRRIAIRQKLKQSQP
jgi:hypothetical protein